ncbi:hypothetical protein ACFYNO_34670 [Kitasatospora sp. NPDC006697]|uniref:WXG100 family type VII secretion target n=1 Tax=Kitasatospora sp. NPDC006697 TaxID=3364020 RepID=UPI0036AF55A4
MSSNVTDFSGYSHAQLRTMVEALNSGDVMSASDPWRRASDTLKQIRTALGMASGDATQSWQGTSSDAFYSAMTKLANNVNNTAAYANDAANTLQMMSEAIDQAKHDMPEEPGFWDQVGNAVSDTFENAIGNQSDATQIPITDQRKAQAVAVMQTLANKYRTAVPVLKPPGLDIHGEQDVPPPDPTAAAALSAFVMGSGLGAIGGYSTAPETTQAVSRAVVASSSPAPAPRQIAAPASSPAPADSGIAGGVPSAAPKPPRSAVVGVAPAGAGSSAPGPSTPVNVSAPAAPSTVGASPAQLAAPSAGTGLDHTALAPSVPGAGPSGLPSGPVGGSGTPKSGTPFGLGTGSGRLPSSSDGFDAPWPKNGEGSRGTGGGRVGPVEGEEGGGAGPGRRGAFSEQGGSTASGRGVFAEEGGSAASGRGLIGGEAVGRGTASRRRPGGAVGEGEMPFESSRGAAGKEEFTRGGSGLGARSRIMAEAGAEEARGEGMGTGMGLMPGEARDTKRKKKRQGERADYLVEDEETWVSDQDATPGVVE